MPKLSLTFAVFAGLGPTVRVDLPPGVTRDQHEDIRKELTRSSDINLRRS